MTYYSDGEKRDACPKCHSTEIWQESADVGVGVIYGPMGCPECGWSEAEEYDLSDGRSPVDERGGVIDQYGGYHPPGSSMALAYRLADSFE
jgi:predicted nucleic-acid-binding Zn-ribbon protein